MSNPSPMSQAMSRDDTRWKTLSRVEVLGAQLAIVSPTNCVPLATGELAVAFEETNTAGGAEFEGN